jgi:hypothetical protein
MAFKKTSGRSVFVQPTGMPNLSGFSKAASTWQDVAKVGHSIGADMRKQKLNKLILTAEAEGRTAGATYDKDNNLVPITNLNTGTAIEQQVFGTGEKETLRAAYRQSAIKTYTASVSQDTKSFVANLLLEDPANPDKIRGSLEGYIEGLGIDDDVKSYVMPDIVSRFVTAENQAAANQKIAVDKNTELVNTAHITDLFQRLSVLSANGPLESGNGLEGQLKMEEELRNDIEGSYQALESIGYTEAQIDAIDKAGNQLIQEQSLIGHIERVYINSNRDYAASLSAIKDIEKSLANTTDFDVDAISKGMTAHLNSLRNINVAEIQAETKRNSDISGTASLNISMGNIKDVSQILSLSIDDGSKKILITQLNSLKLAEATAAKSREATRKSLNNDLFNTHMISIKNEEGDPQRQADDSVRIQAMIESGDLTPLQITQYQSEVNKIAKKQIKAKTSLAWADINSQMGESSGYSLTVNDLKDMTPMLMEQGLVGTEEGKGQQTPQAWQKSIASYGAKKKIYDDKQTKVLQAINRLRNGTSTNQKSDAAIVAEVKAIDLVEDEQGRTLTHGTPAVAGENIKKALDFTIGYKALHPSIAEALTGLGDDAENLEAFELKIGLYDTIFDSILRGTTESGTTDFAMPNLTAKRFLAKQGVDVTEYELAKIQGFKKYQITQTIKESDNADRFTRNIDAQYGSVRNAVKENFHEATAGSGFFEYLANNLVPFYDTDNAEVLNMMDRIRTNVPDHKILTGDIEDAFIGDERLLSAIEASVINQFATKNYPLTDKGMQTAIQHALTMDLGDDMVGISVDSDGEPYWTTASWYKDASVSIGDYQYPGTISDVVFGDIRSKALMGGQLDPKVRELIEGDGVISLEANSVRGKAQTYRVIVRDPDDEYNITTIMPHYKFDFSSSPANGAMIAARQRAKNSSVISFMEGLPKVGGVASQALIRSQAQFILDDLENNANIAGTTEPEGWTGMLEIMQAVNDFVNPFYDSSVDEKYDVGDVKLLRAFLRGDFTDTEFESELEKYYE